MQDVVLASAECLRLSSFPLCRQQKLTRHIPRVQNKLRILGNKEELPGNGHRKLERPSGKYDRAGSDGRAHFSEDISFSWVFIIQELRVQSQLGHLSWMAGVFSKEEEERIPTHSA